MDVYVRQIGRSEWLVSNTITGGLSLSTFSQAIEIADRWMRFQTDSRLIIVADGTETVIADSDADDDYLD